MPYNILIVDDEESICFTFAELLGEDGYEIETAECLERAISLVESKEYDVVFLDIMLGQTSGIDVLKVVKQVNPHCPVIMMTGGPDIKTAAESVRYGAFDYLTKPVHREDLLLHAKRAIDYKRTLDIKDCYQKRMSAVFEGIEEGIMVFDSDYMLIDINPAAMEMLGIGSGETGNSLYEIIETSNCQILKALQESITERVEGELYQIALPQTDGHQQIIGARLSPLTTVSGKDNDFVLTLRETSTPVKELLS